MKPGEILIGTTVAVIGGVTAFASSSQGEISPLMIFTTPTNPDVIVSCIGVLGAAFGLFLTWRGVQGTATRKQADELIEGQKQAKAGLAEANRTARGEGAQTRTAIAEDGEKTRALLEELLAERREARQAVGQAPDAQADLSFEEAVAAILSSTDAREAPARQALADKRPIDAADELMKVSRQEQAAIDDMGKATAARYREAGALYYGVNDKKALEAYREAAKLDISDVWSLIYLTRLEKSQMGNIGAARKWAEAGLKAAANERDRAAAYDALGNVALADNDVAGARAAYQASADIAKRLAAAEGAGADAQRDYSVSLDKLGDVALADKDVAGARAAYQASADIFKKLAAAEGAGADAQRDYSVSLEKLGNVALADIMMLRGRGQRIKRARIFSKGLPRQKEPGPMHSGICSCPIGSWQR